MYGYYTERNYSGELPYTDLAVERRRAELDIPGVEYSKEPCGVGHWERIRICTKRGADSIGRPMGLYHTLATDRVDRLSDEQIEDAKVQLASELCMMLDESDIFPGRILVVGLGNRNLTPDSVGCLTAELVRPTIHIKEWDMRAFTKLRCAEIAVITPGVAATSGLDAAVVVKSLCDLVRPDLVIGIDALATSSVQRLGSSIQISNSGISPGSGLGNPRLAIGVETVGVPVLSVGVPTVIDSRLLCDTEDFSKEPMFVSPKEINEIVGVSARIISGGINRAFGIG